MVCTLLSFTCAVVCVVMVDGQTIPDGCSIEEFRLSCSHVIPLKIPLGITDVFITDYQHNTIPPEIFTEHTSWGNVFMLDININVDNRIFIKDNDFVGLNSLTYLGIHSRHTDDMEENCFLGLQNLTELDFSGCMNLKTETFLTPMMQALPSIRFLNLMEVQTDIVSPYLIISDAFIDMLLKKKITRLNLSGTNIRFVNVRGMNKSSQVSHLDISNTTYISNANNFDTIISILFNNIISLNVSAISSRLWASTPVVIVKDAHSNPCDPQHMTFNLFLLERFYANDVLSDTVVEISSSFVNMTCAMNLQILELRGNNIQCLNGTIMWPHNNSMRKLDLSSNSLSYISPNIVDGLMNLKYLYLSHNMLSQMSSLPDFIKLFDSLVKLEQISLDHNSLTYLPRNMFTRNTLLKILSLKGNSLTSITFSISQLKKLQLLDLSNNRIMVLDGNAFNKIKSFDTKTNSIRLEGNPIECSCKNLPLVEWIHLNLANETNIECMLDAETVNINNEAVASVHFLCIRTVVYVTVSMSTLLFAISIASVSICWYRRRERRRNRNIVQMFLEKFRGNKLKENYICLLSYSSTGNEMVTIELYEMLNMTLKEILGLDKDLVCLDSKHFRAGVSIISEIMRCVSESCVAVFVVSNAFCRSNYCCLEIKEAYEQQKPIILIFSEEIDENLMPLHLQNIFKRFTRSSLFRREGEIDLQPGGWKGLGDSIILLAAQYYADLRHSQQYVI